LRRFWFVGLGSVIALVISLITFGPLNEIQANAAVEASVDVCKVKNKYKASFEEQPWLYESNAGFPKGKNRLPSSGTIKAVMLFVEFTDVKGTDSPKEQAAKFTQFFNQYWDSVSRKKIKFEFTVPNKYFKINKKSSVYQMHVHSQGDATSYLNDAISVADPEVDFTGTDVVYVIPPSGIKKIVYGPAFPLDGGGNAIKTAEGTIYSAAVGGSDARNQNVRTRGVWLAHETGHLFGLPHPYNESNISVFDLMHWDVGAPELLGWSRYVNKWVSDSEVDCIDLTKAGELSKTYTLEPLSNTGSGKKLVILKTSSTKVVVLENRRATVVDRLTSSEEGVIAYEVDMAKQADYYIKFLNKKSQKNGRILGTNRPGTQHKVNKNVTINFLSSAEKGDTFTVTATK